MKSYVIKTIYVQEEFFTVWQEFEEILKKKGKSKSRVISELVEKYVKEEKKNKRGVEEAEKNGFKE